MKVAVVGLGYVGIANSIMLAKNNNVVGLDIDPDRVDCLNSNQLPFRDSQSEKYLEYAGASFTAIFGFPVVVRGI
jgi:UDPglucose 6-dehydrogenase